jgi:hypothetical protein
LDVQKNNTLEQYGSWHHFLLQPTSSNTTLTFIALHLESKGFFPFFLEDYELKQDFELSYEPFKLTFQCMPNLSASGRFGTMFEHLRNYFYFEDSMSGFPQLFQLYF